MLSCGKQFGTCTVYNGRLLMFILRNRAPERFTGGRAKGPDAVGKMKLERLKKEWREEWEAEQNRVSPEEIHAGIERKVERPRERVEAERATQWKSLSEETREAMKHAEELKSRDLAVAGMKVKDDGWG